MTPAARLSAAIEVLDDMARRPRPASDALADWGKAHRFAGSGDRGAIGNLVFDALRRRASIAHRMGCDGARALVLGVHAFHWATPEATQALATGEGHAPAPLDAAEIAAIHAAPGPMAPAVAGDYPAFLDASLERVYGEGRAAEMALYGARAPIDLRVNTLKAERRRILADLERFAAAPGRYAPTAIRVPVPGGPQRAPAIEAEAAYRTGKVELQDEGSQIASLLVDPPPGAQVADLCAGAGGKTLALAAALDNAGQIHAYDADRHRLKAIHERLQRASARNVQVLRAGDEAALDALSGRMDRVVLDVPCTGSGAWRRKPDSKWRLRPQALVQRNGEQDALLRRGAGLVRRGGRLVYVTCSVLAEENEDRIAAFLGAPEGRDFAVFDLKPLWRRLFASQAPEAPTGVATGPGLRLSPGATGTDGFYVCALERRA